MRRRIRVHVHRSRARRRRRRRRRRYRSERRRRRRHRDDDDDVSRVPGRSSTASTHAHTRTTLQKHPFTTTRNTVSYVHKHVCTITTPPLLRPKTLYTSTKNTTKVPTCIRARPPRAPPPPRRRRHTPTSVRSFDMAPSKKGAKTTAPVAQHDEDDLIQVRDRDDADGDATRTRPRERWPRLVGVRRPIDRDGWMRSDGCARANAWLRVDARAWNILAVVSRRCHRSVDARGGGRSVDARGGDGGG